MGFDQSSVLFLGALLLPIVVAISYFKNRELKSIILSTLIYGYAVLLITVTVFPIRFVPDGELYQITGGQVNLIPFKSIAQLLTLERTTTLRNILGNILLLMPLAYYLSFRTTVKKVVIYGVGLSLSIELVQLALLKLHVSYRVVDVDDLILNALGLIIGIGIHRITSKNVGQLLTCSARSEMR